MRGRPNEYGPALGVLVDSKVLALLDALYIAGDAQNNRAENAGPQEDMTTRNAHRISGEIRLVRSLYRT